MPFQLISQFFFTGISHHNIVHRESGELYWQNEHGVPTLLVGILDNINQPLALIKNH